MTKLVTRNNKILRKVAREVSPDEITSQKIKKIIADMKEALKNEEDGVAIAAPQIGKSYRIFIVSKRAFSLIEEIEGKSEENSSHKDIVFINPVIIKRSKKERPMEEGCLSVRWLYGKVKRNEKARVKAYDEEGKIFERGGSGIMAQIYQHEIDHLDGILFIDKARDVKEMQPEERRSARTKKIPIE